MEQNNNKLFILEKKQFIRFLKENNCYKEYCRNFSLYSKKFIILNQNRKTFISYKKGIDEIINKRILNQIDSEIEYSFRWRDTFEGHDYWSELSHKWEKISKEIINNELNKEKTIS